MKVMIVDDSRFMRLTLRNMLEHEGKYEVIGEADNDVSAVAKYKELKPDVVTMDIIMPIESGLRAVKEIVEFDPNAKIIMVSAMGQEKIVEEAINLGAKGFVVKPIVPQKLFEAIDKVMKG